MSHTSSKEAFLRSPTFEDGVLVGLGTRGVYGSQRSLSLKNWHWSLSSRRCDCLPPAIFGNDDDRVVCFTQVSRVVTEMAAKHMPGTWQFLPESSRDDIVLKVWNTFQSASTLTQLWNRFLKCFPFTLGHISAFSRPLWYFLGPQPLLSAVYVCCSIASDHLLPKLFSGSGGNERKM